jgi:MFS family permease
MASLVWGFAGVGLALVVPNAQSLLADVYAPEHRGEAFGKMHCFSFGGGAMAAVLCTNLGAFVFI